MNTRYLAASIINDVSTGRSLSDCLPAALVSLNDPRDAAFVQALCYGVCRLYPRLDALLSHLLQKPMKAKDADVHSLLLVGLYQLTEMRTPPHAAVAETVNATQKLKKTWSRGFVNAVLREYLRHPEKFNAALAEDEEAHFAHPAWWIDAIKDAWPTEWEAVLAANNEHPPFSLRVNAKHMKREDYLALLAKENMPAHPIAATTSGITLETACNVEKLPGFAAGDVFIQDGAAQLAAGLLDLAPGQLVLDACAAPGGKLTHILETEPQVKRVIAIEEDVARIKSIQENLTRLNLSADCVCADAGDLSAWWDNQLFDRILLDAPCSASGVVRRHPDIKLLREPEDIPALADTQLHLLQTLWQTLKPGGLLVYATCSIFPAENVDVIKTFLTMQADAKDAPIDANWGITCEIGRQILPGQAGMDGFYYARLMKTLK